MMWLQNNIPVTLMALSIFKNWDCLLNKQNSGLTKKPLISSNKKKKSIVHDQKKNQIFYFLWMFCETMGIAMKTII